MSQAYIPLYIHGGIGDLIVALPFIELFKNRDMPVRCYTIFPEVMAIYLPWVEMAPRIQLQDDAPAWYVEVTDIVRFRFRQHAPLPDFMQRWYRNYLCKMPEWVSVIDNHPRSCNEMGALAVSKGLHRTRLAHYLIGESYIPYELDDEHRFTREPHITIHDGFDSNYRYDVSMKSWPVEHWEALVENLKTLGPVLQLGGPKHRPIRNVDHNYASRLSFRDSLKFLYSARIHIDTDSGLVHARHLLGKPSVVMFGPTNIRYFGYPENVNIAPNVCGNCWWKKPNWMEFCVNGYEKARCMHSIEPDQVFNAVLGALK